MAVTALALLASNTGDAPKPKLSADYASLPSVLRARDVNGFRLGMTVREVAAIAPLVPLGAGQFKASFNSVEYDFEFTRLGHLFRITSRQQLGRFVVDARFTRELTAKLTAKYGPPKSNHLPAGADWGSVVNVIGADGQPRTVGAESLSAMLQTPFNGPVELDLQMMDFRIMMLDDARLNKRPRDAAAGAVSF